MLPFDRRWKNEALRTQYLPDSISKGGFLMYDSRFASDIGNMLLTLRNGGMKLMGIEYFLTDFDRFCADKHPDASILTSDVAESWIHNATTDSKAHMCRRVNAMKHLGRYQLSLGKPAYIPDYTIHKGHAEEPRLFSDGQCEKRRQPRHQDQRQGR